MIGWTDDGGDNYVFLHGIAEKHYKISEVYTWDAGGVR